MPTIFSLVRHGTYALLDEALGGRGAFPLSQDGRAQAMRVAAALSERPIATVISSPVQRARETAEPIATRLGVAVQIDPAFAEIDFGDWTGARFEVLHDDPAWRRWNEFRSTARASGGESILQVQVRAIAGIMRLAAEYPQDEVAIVSHADVIKAILMHFLGMPLDLMRRVEIGAGSVSRFVLFDTDVKVVAINLPA